MILNGLTLEEAKEIIMNNKRPTESVIKWRTGEPKEKGDYLVSLKNGCVKFDNFGIIGEKWFVFNSDFILAWCPISEIKPYKE